MNKVYFLILAVLMFCTPCLGHSGQKEFRNTLNKLYSIQDRLEKEGNVIIARSQKNKNTVSMEDRRKWGKISHQVNTELKNIQGKEILKNKNVPIQTVEDKAKLEIGLYLGSLRQLWDYLNRFIAGKKVDGWKWKELTKDIKSSTKEAEIALKYLELGGNDLKKLE